MSSPRPKRSKIEERIHSYNLDDWSANPAAFSQHYRQGSFPKIQISPNRVVPDSVKNLFEPMGWESFLKNYFDREPIKIASGKFKNLKAVLDFQSHEVLSTLRGGEVDLRDIRFFSRGKKPLPLESQDELRRHLRRPCSKVINNAEWFFAGIRPLLNDLSDFLGFPTNAVLFNTPKGFGTVPAHWDTKPVIVLQLKGKKEWDLYESVICNSVDGHHSSERTGAGITLPENYKVKHLGRYTLNPGDVLHVPRGVIHCTRAEDTSSWHLTMVVVENSWIHLLDAVTKHTVKSLADRSPPFRAFAGIFENTKASQALYEKLFKKFLYELENNFKHNSKNIYQEYLTRYEEVNLEASSQDASGVFSDSVIQRSATFIAYAAHEGFIEIKANRRTLTIPEQYEGLVKEALQKKKISVRDLCDGDPTQEQIFIIRKMVGVGMFHLVKASV
jgi:ribosomal protein L16 Arg81 hydroxylase